MAESYLVQNREDLVLAFSLVEPSKSSPAVDWVFSHIPAVRAMLMALIVRKMESTMAPIADLRRKDVCGARHVSAAA